MWRRKMRRKGRKMKEDKHEGRMRREGRKIKQEEG
jgi:hypothetical protein